MNELEKKRLERAQEIANQVKNGEYIPARLNTLESFWPMRPTIKKDKVALARLYGKDTLEDGQT